MKHLRYISIVAITFLAVFFVSCKSTSRSTRQQHSTSSSSSSTQTSSALSEEVPLPPADTLKYDCLIGNFTCSTDDFSISGQVRLKKDSVLWLSASKIIELGRAKFTKDSVFLYAKIASRYFHGTYKELEQVVGISTDFATIQAIFAGDNEMLRRNWIVADFSDWREIISVRENGQMIKNKRYPYSAEVAVRSSLFSGAAHISYSKVQWVHSTTFPYSVSSLARRYDN